MITNYSIKGFNSQIRRTADQKGKSLEEQIRLASTTKAPIESIAPEIYTPLKEGVLPQYNIRADRQEIALDLTEKYDKSKVMHSDEQPSEEAEAAQENVKEPIKNE